MMQLREYFQGIFYLKIKIFFQYLTPWSTKVIQSLSSFYIKKKNLANDDLIINVLLKILCQVFFTGRLFSLDLHVFKNSPK